VKYPKPSSVIFIELTTPPSIIAVAVAFVVGGGSEITIVGADVYPAPPAVLVIEAMGKPLTGVPNAVVPPKPGAEKVAAGFVE